MRRSGVVPLAVGARVVCLQRIGHIGHMRRTSLAEAKARLSALVDDAEHRRRKTLILRHGKPSAAIVPVDVVLASERSTRRSLSARDIAALFDAVGAGGRRGAVIDLLAGRR
jgi:prevent-host-death family protein